MIRLHSACKTSLQGFYMKQNGVGLKKSCSVWDQVTRSSSFSTITIEANTEQWDDGCNAIGSWRQPQFLQTLLKDIAAVSSYVTPDKQRFSTSGLQFGDMLYKSVSGDETTDGTSSDKTSNGTSEGTSEGTSSDESSDESGQTSKSGIEEADKESREEAIERGGKTQEEETTPIFM